MTNDDVQIPTLVVAEVFGPTCQGEGPSMGRRCGFVRLGGCNLHCSWCDTPYTWDASRFDLRTEMARVPAIDVAAALRAMRVDLVVISGGEPMLQQDYLGMSTLIVGLRGIPVEIETNGTRAPNDFLAGQAIGGKVSFNVSPKLAHTGDPTDLRVVPDAIIGLRATGAARFKFVVRADTPEHIAEDLDQIAAWRAGFGVPCQEVWVMPEGTTVDAVLAGTRALADPAIAAGYNLTTRLHTLVWGNERKR